MQKISDDRTLSGRQSHLALERLPAAAYTCDADGLITYFNDRALQLWGRAPKLNSFEDRYCGSFRLFYQDGSPMAHENCWMARALEERREFRNQPVVIERADRSRVTALANANPMFDEAGIMIGASNVLVDVTRSSELARVQERLAAIVDSSDDSITSTTVDGYITSWNAGATRIFGYTEREVVGKHISLFLPPEKPDEQAGILDRLQRGERVDHFETTRLRRDGSRVHLSMTMSPLRGSDGRIVGFSAIARDITEQKVRTRELKAAKEAAEAANRTKDRFLAVVGHELRAPLNAISLAATALGVEGDLLPAMRARIDMILRNVSLENHLIEDLLDHSRIAAGRLHIKAEPVPVNVVLADACDSLAPQFAEKGVRLESELDENAGQVIGDRLRLRQIFGNVLQNALKFTPAGGTVFVGAARACDDRVVVSIRDTGSGIAPAFLPNIFEPFETETTGNTRHGGLGLGLAICESLVQRHGGSIVAHSDGPGHGSTFVVDLPRAD